jgi:hypothetical protein
VNGEIERDNNNRRIKCFAQLELNVSPFYYYRGFEKCTRRAFPSYDGGKNLCGGHFDKGVMSYDLEDLLWEKSYCENKIEELIEERRSMGMGYSTANLFASMRLDMVNILIRKLNEKTHRLHVDLINAGIENGINEFKSLEDAEDGLVKIERQARKQRASHVVRDGSINPPYRCSISGRIVSHRVGQYAPRG